MCCDEGSIESACFFLEHPNEDFYAAFLTEPLDTSSRDCREGIFHGYDHPRYTLLEDKLYTGRSLAVVCTRL